MDKKFKIFVIIALVALAALAATATVVAFTFMNKANQAAESNKGEGDKVNKEDMVLLPLKEAITSNIAGDETNYHILRVQVSLQIDGSAKSSKIFLEEFKSAETSQEVAVRDAIIKVIRQQTYEMVMKQDAQDKIGEQLTNTLNQLLDTDIIKGVYFGDFFVQ